MPTHEHLRRFKPEELIHELRVRAALSRDDRETIAATRFADHPLSAFRAPNAARTMKPHPDLTEMPSEEIFKAARAQQKSIYGVDDRLDIINVGDTEIQLVADSVAALFKAADVISNGDGTSSLRVEPYGTAYGLCQTERFRTQPIGAFCTGFLVGPDLIATAGHCVEAIDVRDRRCVFGYRMLDDDNAQTIIPKSDIYKGNEIVGRVLTSGGPDWAIIRLDRPVEGRTVAHLRRAGMAAAGQSVYVIGHPVGLPLKFADGARITDNSPSTFFSANLDTFGGNSGSPVFSVVDGKHIVEGILVRGEPDFVKVNGCTRSQVYPTTGAKGENCTRVAEFAHLVPKD